MDKLQFEQNNLGKQTVILVEQNDQQEIVKMSRNIDVGLIEDCLTIIGHQQYLLDNLDHLESYNAKLLEVWKQQINLLDSYDRFQYYKQLGRIKEVLGRMKVIGGSDMMHRIFDWDFNNVEEFQGLNEFMQCLKRDFEKGELEDQQNLKVFILYLKCRIENSQELCDHDDDGAILRNSFNLMQKNRRKDMIKMVIEFIIKLIGIKQDSNQSSKNDWRCELCQDQNWKNLIELIDHIERKHLKFLWNLLMGQKDQCFYQKCCWRRNVRRFETQEISEHLSNQHSEIYFQDRIFSKMYEGMENKAGSYFYGRDAKNWKTKFSNNLLEWLKEVNVGADQYLKDSRMLELRGNKLFQSLRSWMEKDEELLRCKVESNYKEFDQLCFLLKMTWYNQCQTEGQEIDWIRVKLFKGDIRRIHLIQQVADLLNTKKTLIHQLHRYLYLGIFNFKICQTELNGRIQSLEKIVKQMGIFQSVVYHWREFHDQCLFGGVLCDVEKSGKFQTPFKMLEHYYEGHLGVFYALADFQMDLNLAEEFQSGRIKAKKLKDVSISELIFFLHDYYKADYKTKTRKFMRESRKNFQLKSVCCDCSKELFHLGQVYWKENEIGRKKLELQFKHEYSVREVIAAYKQPQDLLEGAYTKKEMDSLQDQSYLYKQKLFTQMRNEILYDDKGRQSHCKECNKKMKGFNPLLRELKAEYFQLPSQEMMLDNVEDRSKEVNLKLEIKEDDPQFIKVQKQILNREVENRAGGSWSTLKEQMAGGYFKLESFPKLVNIYGNISESIDQNPRKVISQPILTGYMKVIFQTPLIYVSGTSILYEMQPQWAKVRQRFKLVAPGSESQRKEMIQLLESHPIMQNHSYQVTRMTKLCVDQVDLMFQLNKHLIKQTKSGGQVMNGTSGQEEQLQDAIGKELQKTTDLLYFEGVLHRAQVTFLIQQFRIWQEVFFENVQQIIKTTIRQELMKNEQNQKYDKEILIQAKCELNQFLSSQDQKLKNLTLMLVLSQVYCQSALRQMNFEGFQIEIQLSRSSHLIDFLLSEDKGNPIRFIIDSNLIPILTPLISQFIHPIFVGTLLQIFQLDYNRSLKKKADEQTNKQFPQAEAQQLSKNDSDPQRFYLHLTYDQLCRLTMKRCLPLFDANNITKYKSKFTQHKQGGSQQLQEINEEDEESNQEVQIEKAVMNQRREKLKRDERWFQLKMFNKLNYKEQIDMQCRYVLAKRSLIKVLNSNREDPPVDCDLRWAMQIGQMFFHSIQKRAAHGKDDENKAARQFVKDLRELKEEVDHFFHKQKFKKNGQEIVSDLRNVLEEIVKEDQRANINQVFNRNPYKFIHQLKIAYFIPMEKKLQDINECLGKLRSLPHRQAFRSMEKFHKYNFRELELLAFPELFATGQGFQQYMAPKIERSNIVIEIKKEEQQSAQNILRNLPQFQADQQQQQLQMNQVDASQLNSKNKLSIQKFEISAALSDFTIQQRQGQGLMRPNNAILKLEKENFIKSGLSCAFIYDFQKISVIKTFQEAQQCKGVEEKSFLLEQDMEINIVGGEALHESLKDQHILKNFRQLLKKQTNWSNECQSFVNQVSDEVGKQNKKLKMKSGESNNDLLDYIRLQEKLFLEKKRKELENEFKNIDLSDLDILRKQHHIDIKKAKIKKTKKGVKKSSILDLEDEIHSSILESINPLDEMAEQIQQAAATFSQSYTSLGEDSKFRLVNKNTRVFNNRYSFIFWRFTQRLLSRILHYYTIVNGINFYQNKKKEDSKQTEFEKKQIKELDKLPPTKGSHSYFKQLYKEQRAVCFQKGTPYFFLTYTFYEFDKKTYQIVQGLNFFDLESGVILKNRQKRMEKRQYNQLQKHFTIYFHYLCKMITECIMKSQVKINKSTKIWLYDFGMYGPCFGYTNRFEFQQRGTIHMHQLLYFKKEAEGQIQEKLLEYWAGAFSLWNYKKQSKKDKALVEKYQLNHNCSDDCIKADDGNCRKGFPRRLSARAYWKSDSVNQIYPRVQDEQEKFIFMHDRDVIKIFNSTCIIEACGSEKIINYITKYLHKGQKQLGEQDEKEKQVREIDLEAQSSEEEIQRKTEQLSNQAEDQAENKQEEKKFNEEEDQEEKLSLKQQANNLLHRVISKKITSLSEALADLLDYPLFKTSFTTIKIAQVPLNEQFKMNIKTLKMAYDVDDPQEDLKTQIKSCIWLKYLSRPEELNALNLSEYAFNFVWYGGKEKYKRKSEEQQNQEQKIYFLDLNGQIVKQREKAIDVIINLSQCYYLEDLDYEPNLYYLAMLQLFWPHRQVEWLKETNDTQQGFKQFYYKLYNENEERIITVEGSQKRLFEKYCIHQTFKQAVDNYKSLTSVQQRFLKAVHFSPQKKKDQAPEQIKRQKQFFQYHLLLRAKNIIIKIGGLIQQEQSNFKHGDDILKVLKYLRPDILINSDQKELILKVESTLIEYLKSFTSGWNALSSIQKTIFEELSSLLKLQNFHRLSSFIYKNQQVFQTPNQADKQNKFQQIYESLSEQKISQNEIQMFSNYEDENIEFPQHFRTKLTRSELKFLIRPKMKDFMFTLYQPSDKLSFIYSNQLNSHQRLALIIILNYLYLSQVEEEEFSAIYEGCLIHGGGGVGKSFLIEFLIDLFEEIDEPFFILCPTQVAVQNIMKDRNNQHNIMTIHSFFHLSPNASIDTYYDHFYAFLKDVQKDHLFKNSTADLYPELSFYNCMNKVEKFTSKLKGVHCIILEEISMIPPKFLTLLDVYLQVSLNNNQTFGGIQVIAFGDSFQLQPVTHPPAYYFQSHVFQNGYFSTCLELSLPIRQADDLEFFTQILQPIRIGRFQSHLKHRDSFLKLKLRHLDEKINNETGLPLASGLQAQVQRLQIDNLITFLYFDNEAVTVENQLRADQHIQSIQLKYQNNEEKFRQFINCSARLSFGLQAFKEDQLLMNLSEEYQIDETVIANDYKFTYAQHFKLLPLSVRNYIMQKLLSQVYERAVWENKNAQRFPLHIKLFKTANIIFRKNLVKEQKIINGQAAIIKDILFEVDFKNDNQLLLQAQEKQQIIQKQLSKGLIRQSDNVDYLKINLASEFIEKARQELEFEVWNNINCLRDEDILESEKINFIKIGMQPRLSELSFQIQGSAQTQHLRYLEKYFQDFKIQVPSNRIKGVIREALNSIRQLIKRMQCSSNQSSQTISEITEKMIISDQKLLLLFGLDILKNNLNSHLFARAETHLAGLMDKLNEEWTPMVISQLPINLGYARTIHTSQGATFDNVCVTLDQNHMSRPGLLYTAFSRVRNLRCLFLQGDLKEELFMNTIPEELRLYYEYNFIQADELLLTKFFSALTENQAYDFKQVLNIISQENKQIRSKLLKQLPRRM